MTYTGSMETITTDVLVIGGGAAGSRAAYEAKRAEPGLSVTMVLDRKWGLSGSSAFDASELHGINAPLDLKGDGDSPEIFFKDIIDTGLGLTDDELCRIVAEESADRILELMDLGVSFDTRDGKTRQVKLSGCTRSRSLCIDGRTGTEIVLALKKACLRIGVEGVEGLRIIDLATEDREVIGAWGMKNDKVVLILARAVVLANGGAGALFSKNVTHASLRGDGMAMAYRAGAALTNMEFIQIGPSVVKPRFNWIIHSHIWDHVPTLKNAMGEQFLANYLPQGVTSGEVLTLKSMSFPFSVRTAAKYLDIAIAKEISAGRGTRNGGVHFDLTHLSEESLKESSPATFNVFLKHGINLATDPIEIAPLVQSFNGGVLIDEFAATAVPGLFAVGEVSGGVHGADRPGGNNLADTQVFGFRGGRAAADLATQRPHKNSAPVPCLASVPDSMQKKIDGVQKELDKALMVVRTREGLEELLKKVELVQEGTEPLHVVTDNYLTVVESIARSALFREESRGSHYRDDFPDENPALARQLRIRMRSDKSMDLSTKG